MIRTIREPKPPQAARPTPAAPVAVTPATALANVLVGSALAAVFTLLVVHYSLTRGKLIVPAHYDDVTYLRDGLDKLDGFYKGGLPGIVGRVSLRPPHSPFSTSLAFTGYALFGIHDWAPYAGNAIVILALLALVDFATHGMRPWQQVIAGMFVLTIPISAQAVYEFRSDLWVGVLTAAVIVLLLEQPLVRASRAYLAWTGIVAGVALLSKTSIFPVTLGLCGSALF
ncbi:MAG TPA: glycosyltransferase family 39 protein, partial [Tepidisphaeraceae bacterium]